MLCKATNKQDRPCKAHAMSNGFCYRHNPDIAELDKLAASRNGGLKVDQATLAKTASPRNIRTFNGLISLIESNINDVRAGRIDPRTSNAVVQNIGVLLKVYDLAIIDTRLRKLEEQAGIDSPTELILGGYN